jgi:DNA-binding CsgD family transcriptional regulator/tetratricopeptide (TPR) repeat protein
VLYGRAGEIDRVNALLDAAAEGQSGAVVFVGEPGAGKSALLDAACDLASGVTTVLRAGGVGSESDLPFAGLDQLLRPILDRLDRLPTPQAAALRGALGMESTGTSDTHNVSLGVLTLLGEAGDGNPVLAVVDDAHWLDHESARALVFAARRLHAEGVVMLFGARTGQFDASSLPEIALGPLDTDATAEIIQEGSGTEVAYDVAQRITAATGGNALAVAELATLLTAGQISGRDPLPLNLPVSARLDSLFADRIEGLTEACRQVLLVAAADDTGSTSVVFSGGQRLGSQPDDLEGAERLGLVEVDGTEVRFRHPLVRSGVYGTATFSERRRAHSALADVFEQLGDEDRAAWHKAAGALAPDAEAAEGLDRAAGRAHVRGAYATSANAFEKAAELSDTDQRRGMRLAEAAGEAWLAGLLPRAARLVESAEQLVQDPSSLAECYRVRGSIELATGAAPNTAAILIKAARYTAGVDPGRAVELLALAGEGASLGVDTGAANEIREIAAGLTTSESVRDQFFARLLVGFTRLPDDPEVASSALREAIAFAEDETEDVDLLLAAGRAAFYIGDDAAALEFHSRILDRARRIASVGCLAIAGSRMALAEMLVGRWGPGMATAEETSRMAEDTGQMELAAHAVVWQGLVAAWRGESDECRRLTERAHAITLRHPMLFVEDAIRWVNGVLELGFGRAPSASAHLRGIVHPVIMNAASLDGVEAAILADDIGETDRWMRWLVETATLSDSGWARARLAHGQALLAEDPVEAEQLFDTALSEHSQGNRSFERARTELAYGTFLRRQRRRVDARGHLRSALTTFDELGAVPWADRAQAELRASGETARRRDSSTILDLTPQELQVANFVVQGMTNREVAAQMFLSPRTIDYHLRSVFTKLGITSRTELAKLRADTPIASSTKS